MTTFIKWENCEYTRPSWEVRVISTTDFAEERYKKEQN